MRVAPMLPKCHNFARLRNRRKMFFHAQLWFHLLLMHTKSLISRKIYAVYLQIQCIMSYFVPYSQLDDGIVPKSILTMYIFKTDIKRKTMKKNTITWMTGAKLCLLIMALLADPARAVAFLPVETSQVAAPDSVHTESMEKAISLYELGEECLDQHSEEHYVLSQ